MNDTLKIWFHRETVTFYAIPKDERFEKGDYLLERFDGVQKQVRQQQIDGFSISAEEAKTQLRAAYDKAMELANKQFSALTQFMDLTGADVQEALGGMAGEAAGFPGGDLIQNLFAQVNTGGTEAEQQQAFKDAFGKIPEVMSFFDREQLEKAAEDPEEWARAMQEKLYGKENAKAAGKRSEALKQQIADQLRRNVEEAENKQKNAKK